MTSQRVTKRRYENFIKKKRDIVNSEGGGPFSRKFFQFLSREIKMARPKVPKKITETRVDELLLLLHKRS